MISYVSQFQWVERECFHEVGLGRLLQSGWQLVNRNAEACTPAPAARQDPRPLQEQNHEAHRRGLQGKEINCWLYNNELSPPE